jgi:hypothetical protein
MRHLALQAVGYLSLTMSASRRQQRVVTIHDFSSSATCYVESNGRDRPEAAIQQYKEIKCVSLAGQKKVT